MPITTARNRVLGATALAKSRSVGSIQIRIQEGADSKLAEERVRDPRLIDVASKVRMLMVPMPRYGLR